MIPHKLTLKNFLSYGDTLTTIDFGPYGLICLSGKNGNGKSALLDAITWAIWGQARKIGGISKPDDGLLRLGATRMMVTLDFSFNNQLYRVRREYVRTSGKPIANLDIEVMQTVNGRFVSMTDKTIRATQEKIEKLIGLDYETFVNSSFIRQGQSNEFSKKSPKERKQILATILGLGHYDALQSKALEHGRMLQSEKLTLERLYALGVQEVAQQEALAAAEKEHQKSEAELRSQLIATEQNSKALEQECHAFQLKIQQKDQLTKELQELTKEFEVARSDYRAGLAAWKQAHQQVLQQQKGTLNESYKAQLELQSKVLVAQQQQMSELQKELTAADTWHEKQFAETEKQKTVLLKDLEKKRFVQAQTLSQLQQATTQRAQTELKKKQLMVAVQQLEKSIAEQSKMLVETQTLATQFEKRRSFYHTFVQRGQWFTRQTTDLTVKKTTIESQDSAHCPLCEQLVTAARKKFLHNKLSKQEQFFSYQKNKVASILKKLKEILLQQHDELKARKECEDQVAQKNAQLVEGQKQLAALHLESTTLEATHTRLTQEAALQAKELFDLETALNKTDPELVTAKLLLEKLKKEMTLIGYDAGLHAQINKELNALYSAKAGDSDEHIKSRRALYKERVLHGSINLKKIIQQARKKREEIRTLDALVTQIQEKERQRLLVGTELATLRQQLEAVVAARARITNEYARINKVQQENLEREKQIKKIDVAIEMYQQVAAAFSKNGVPALLIEDVIPELEAEANALLQKLTNNQAQIFIESVRDLKKGGVKETLDIQISDGSGIRPYEMFSGGEAFRIDFALRIAISKLLARRAGTALQTLIIDEGFGSQDEEGLHHIMDSLYAIQHDFAKIIIVSHLPLMKDNFPVHFVIEKGPLGSAVRVEERG